LASGKSPLPFRIREFVVADAMIVKPITIAILIAIARLRDCDCDCDCETDCETDYDCDSRSPTTDDRQLPTSVRSPPSAHTR